MTPPASRRLRGAGVGESSGLSHAAPWFHCVKRYCTEWQRDLQFGHRSPNLPISAGDNTCHECTSPAARLRGPRCRLAAGRALRPSPRFAQAAWPAKPIRLVVPFPAGGGTDLIARECRNKMTSTGWTIIVDNKPGSGGNLGVDAAAKSPADGYTLVLGQTSNLAINPTLYPKLPYDPVKDLTPVEPGGQRAAGDRGRRRLALQDPGRRGGGRQGQARLASTTRPPATARWRTWRRSVPEGGRHQAHAHPLQGRGAGRHRRDRRPGAAVRVVHPDAASATSRAARCARIAVTSAKRVDDLPQVPTVAESGYKGFEAVTWFGILGPANLPKDVVAKLNADINKALKDPDLRKKLGDQGADVAGSTPEQFAKLIRDDIARWGKVVKESGAKVD